MTHDDKDGRRLLPGVQIPQISGDNLAVMLASWIEPSIDDDEMDESGTWKQGAIDQTNMIFDAIHAHYAAALSDARAEALEEAARWVAKRRDAYIEEHGLFDWATMAMESAGTVDEYVGELDEIEEGIRALKEQK